jgi:hypothetical protein
MVQCPNRVAKAGAAKDKLDEANESEVEKEAEEEKGAGRG